MTVSEEDDPSRKNSERGAGESNQPVRKIRLPGFIIEHEIGLGDIIKHATAAFGIKACSECEQRASSLNKWMVFGPGKNK